MSWRGEQEKTQQFFTDPFDEERSNGSPQKTWLGRYDWLWLHDRIRAALAAVDAHR
jgi:hypothetical protein